jgi:hypothetical protein
MVISLSAMTLRNTLYLLMAIEGSTIELPSTSGWHGLPLDGGLSEMWESTKVGFPTTYTSSAYHH